MVLVESTGFGTLGEYGHYDYVECCTKHLKDARKAGFDGDVHEAEADMPCFWCEQY